MTIIRMSTRALGDVSFVFMAPGEFVRRDSTGVTQEVELSEGFRVQSVPVTVAQYRRFLDAVGWCPDAPIETFDGCWRWNSTFERVNKGHDARPVVGVSYKDAEEYLRWASDLDGRQYRLLTEAEFEYCVRGGRRCEEQCEHPWEVERLREELRHDLEAPPVVGMSANRHGISDLLGSVWQWCSDWYAPFVGERVLNPAGPRRQPDVTIWKGEYRAAGRVIRGGSFSYPSSVCACSHRHYSLETDRNFNLGLRIAF